MRNLCRKWQSYFSAFAMFLMTSSEMWQASLSGDTGRFWKRSPETGVLLFPAAPNLSHTLVMLDVLI